MSVDPDDLTRLSGGTAPTRTVVERVLLQGERMFEADPYELFWDRIERGQARYLIVHDGSGPSEIFFAGLSWD